MLTLAIALWSNLTIAQEPTSPEKLQTEATTPAVLGLIDLEQMALQANPTLVQAGAQIQASRGKALQAGLAPNPTVGFEAEQVGLDGTAGEFQGAFIQQEFVTAGKLRLSRAKYEREAVAAEIQAFAQQHRVLNGVRRHFWDVVHARELISARGDLLRVAEDGERTTEELVNVGQANHSDRLQAQIEARRARVDLRKAETRYQGAWRELAAVVGRSDLCPVSLDGKLEAVEPPSDWDQTLCDLLQASPELQFAMAEVARDQITLRRERVEPIPNVTIRTGAGYNAVDRATVGEFQVGVRLPLFDRNQGTIRQAHADLTRAQAEVRRVEMSLRKRFADASTRYETAWESAEDFRTESLPKARESYDSLRESFQNRRAAWPQILVAYRTYSQLRIEYLAALHDLRRAEVDIRGFLLTDELAAPPGPTPQGHIDAVPKPR